MTHDKLDHAVCSPIIGIHHSPLSQKFGIPRQPNLAAVASCIEMRAPYDTPDAFIGIENFSHLWITWQTHQNKQQSGFRPCVRPPRLGGNAKLGVFATRSTYRPSKLGLSVVTLNKLEVVKGRVLLHIEGADMVDATPIIDIKPYLSYSDSLTSAVSGYATDKPALKVVKFSDIALCQFDALTGQQSDTQGDTGRYYTPELLTADEEVICQLIAQDPRPAYLQQNEARVFQMRYKNIDIHFKMSHDARGTVFMLITEVTLVD